MDVKTEYPSQYADPNECAGWGLSGLMAERSNEAFAEWVEAGKPPKNSATGIAMKHARAQYAAERKAYRLAAAADKTRYPGRGVDVISHFDPDTGPITDTPEGAEYWARVEEAAAADVPNTVGRQE